MPIEVIMPKVDMVMDEGTVGQWYKSEGEAVQAGELLFDIETDKATMEIEAPASGTLARVLAPTGTTVPVATVIAMILEKGESLDHIGEPAAAPSATPPSVSTQAPTQAPAGMSTDVAVIAEPRPRATPLARKLTYEHGLNLALLSGTGPHGRIRKDDVLRFVETMRANSNGRADAPATAPADRPVAPVVPAATPQPATPIAGSAPDAGKLVPLAGVRKIIAERLIISASIPQFVLSIEVELSAALQLRERLPYRPSITAILARVVAALLPLHPTLNASFRDDGIWYHAPVHLGIALDSDGNLLVPVIRDAHQRSLNQVAAALTDIRKRAEAKKLTPSELQGSTFSISNLGMLGVDQFTALVNPPEAAILAVGRSVKRPFEVDGALVFKPVMTLTLSADHRVTDGAAGARFLQDVRAVLEEPLLLL